MYQLNLATLLQNIIGLGLNLPFIISWVTLENVLNPSKLQFLKSFHPQIIPMRCVSRSVVSNSFATPWTVACQSPLSVEFSRQEYRSGLPFSSSEDLPDPGMEPRSPASKADSLLSEPPGKPSQPLQILSEFSLGKRTVENDCRHHKKRKSKMSPKFRG